tara:strand:- start:360 stop:929 length:570 start_codon:yes stop_codon:yes gene_type:complete
MPNYLKPTRSSKKETNNSSILVIRHGSAGSRHNWTRNDTERPLDIQGINQANEIAKFFADRAVSTFLSSGATRCLQTIEPLAKFNRCEINIREEISEGETTAALHLIHQLIKTDEDIKTSIICSHGDVIAHIIHNFMATGTALVEARSCAKGSVWELVYQNKKIIQSTYYSPDSLITQNNHSSSTISRT